MYQKQKLDRPFCRGRTGVELYRRFTRLPHPTHFLFSDDENKLILISFVIIIHNNIIDHYIPVDIACSDGIGTTQG